MKKAESKEKSEHTSVSLAAPKARDVVAQGNALGKLIRLELSAEGA